MTHLHIPDGVLPYWLWIGAYIIIIAYLFGLVFYFKREENKKKLPLVGVIVALMIVAMSIEVVPISYHLNLAAFCGIVLGPLLGVLSVFISSILISFMGHGGITVVGLNTLAVSVEVICAYFGFKFLRKKIKNIFVVTFIVTFLSLFISSWVSIGLVYIGTSGQGNLYETFNAHNHSHENEQKQKQQSLHEADDHDLISHDVHQSHNKDLKTDGKVNFDVYRFMFMVMLLGSVGWTLEGLITGFMVKYINKVKPSLIE